jgi:Tfp pilus assembly protein PilF
MTRLVICCFLFLPVPAIAAELAPAPRAKSQTPPAFKMPLSGLAPAKPMFEACIYRYGVGTASPECQAFVNQGLGMYYSYVYLEAVRSFETATRIDPECAYAWLMLSRSLERYGRGTQPPAVKGQHAVLGIGFATLPDKLTKSAADYSLEMARKLMPQASDRESLLIRSRLQEKGLWPNTAADQRMKSAAASLDELLTLYDDDQEAWFWRAQLAEGLNGRSPFYKALLRVNPAHPGANHELVHFYENIKRPALGWPYAEGYIESSPGIPHAFHMQSHLATRIGKWGPTSDWSWKAIELQKQYHEYQGVTPGEDHQFNHHMETLTRSLIHDGRFAEAKRIKADAESKYKYAFRPEWFRMALAEGDWAEAQKIVDFFRKSDKANGAYYAAMLFLEKGETDRAGAEVDVLRQAQQRKKSDRNGERRLWEAQGRHLCQSGNGEAGLKMLKKCVDATKNDYNHHSWGNGAVLMEQWGIGALECGNASDAEEAFQEALAHDAGSVRGALGLWALCERQGRTDEAERYLKVAHRCWAKADSKDFERLKQSFAAKATKFATASSQ